MSRIPVADDICEHSFVVLSYFLWLNSCMKFGPDCPIHPFMIVRSVAITLNRTPFHFSWGYIKLCSLFSDDCLQFGRLLCTILISTREESNPKQSPDQQSTTRTQDGHIETRPKRTDRECGCEWVPCPDDQRGQETIHGKQERTALPLLKIKKNHLKALDLFGNFQRPVISLGISQHLHYNTNLWKFRLNWSSKLQ